MSSRWLGVAYTITMAAYSLTRFAFGAAKASTKLGFSIARGMASVVPIPFLTTSLNHLQSLSLLPILLGESIASTSLIAASSSLDAITNLIDANDEASFSLASFVTLVRNEWAEHGPNGRSITEVVRAVAAWAAIQGFTKQWSEERWLRSTVELMTSDFEPPHKSNGNTHPGPPGRQRTISRVSVTDDVIIPGRLSQIISADIGEKEIPVDGRPLSSTAFSEIRPPITSRLDSHVPWRSNYETWKNLRRLSKMVLAGYGGAGLLFFGTPLRPDESHTQPSQGSTLEDQSTKASLRTDSQVKDMEEDILIHVVEDAEAEAMSPPMRNVPVSDISLGSGSRPRAGVINPTQESIPVTPSSSYSWWNVLLGRHDREIFEGFAFTPVDDSDRDISRSPLNPSSEASSPSRSRFHSLASSQGSALLNGLSNATSEGSHKKEGPEPPTAIIGDMRHIPRFWVLTDHGRRQVVLIVRGTMSFNELAADLTCEPESFKPATASSPAFSKPVDGSDHPPPGPTDINQLPRTSTDTSAIPFPVGRYPTTNLSDSESPITTSSIPANTEDSPFHYKTTMSSVDGQRRLYNETPRHTPQSADTINDDDGANYQVHGGMLRLARAMGSKGKPVHDAVSAALSRNRGYELVLCGHSLGAGVASLLALMWADPSTCRTVPSSGLPSNRRVTVYCFAPPCITSPSLSRLCKNLITSIVYSFDVVSRLSLGSIRDLNKAAFWLCEGQGEESTVNLLRRSLKGKLGFGVVEDTEDEKKWFIAVRKTLEANMYFAHLFPPGRVWWAVRNESLHPSHQITEGMGTGLRLYEVQQVEEVFRQIEFKGDMLSSHLPHQYDRMLSELEFESNS